LINLRNKLKDTIVSLKNKLKDKIVAVKDMIVTWLTKVWNSIKDLPQKIWNFMEQLPRLIGMWVADALPFGSNIREVGDAVITNKGEVIKTDPQDTIIATKTPGQTGGGHTFVFNGVTPEQMIQEVERILGTSVNRSARF